MNATSTATQEVVTNPTIVADDARGIIEQFPSGTYQSILRITSKAGTVRANHYHKHDSHLCYLVSGKMEYSYRDALDESAPLQTVTILPGQLFYTPPMVAHAMHFLADSEFYAFTTQPRREQADYEDDVVRVTLVEPEVPEKQAI